MVLTARPTAKDQRIPMAGVPYHSAEGYIARLVQAGYKVAVAEQLTAPTVDQETANRRIRLGKKESAITANWAESGVPTHQVGKGRELVERDVVRVITPGTVTEPGMLDARRNNYIAAVVTDGQAAGVAYADITTGEFATTEIRKPAGSYPPRAAGDRSLPPPSCWSGDDMRAAGSMAAYRLWSKAGDEGRGKRGAQRHERPPSPEQYRYPPDETDPHNWALDPPGAAAKHFSAARLSRWVREVAAAIRAAGACWLTSVTPTARPCTSFPPGQYSKSSMTLDPHTRRTGDCDSPAGRKPMAGLDETRTPMGSALAPRGSPAAARPGRLRARQDAVEAFFDNGGPAHGSARPAHNLPT